jgi:uncharacterized protein (DUF697 family)
MATSVAAAIATAASPIPFSDAFLLVPIQVAMLAGISATFGGRGQPPSLVRNP